jgi:hypothetical protein
MSGKSTCIIAATALILMFGVVMANAVYVKSSADRILSLIDASEGNNESIQRIFECWEKFLPLLKLSLSQKELEDITLNINEAIICSKKNDTEEYKRLMARLRRAIENIKKREEFSLENIF